MTSKEQAVKERKSVKFTTKEDSEDEDDSHLLDRKMAKNQQNILKFSGNEDADETQTVAYMKQDTGRSGG